MEEQAKYSTDSEPTMDARSSLAKRVGKLEPDKVEALEGFVKYLESQDELRHDNRNLLHLLPLLLKLQNTKEGQYGRSWCKRGDFSAFFNLERKWDRVDNIMSKAIVQGMEVLEDTDKISTPSETFIDTLCDTGLYALMWAGFVAETRKEQFEKFLELNDLK